MLENENLEEQQKDQTLEESDRRKFLGKFGRLSATLPVGMLVLMGPTQSQATSSDNDGGLTEHNGATIQR